MKNPQLIKSAVIKKINWGCVMIGILEQLSVSPIITATCSAGNMFPNYFTIV